MTSEQRRVLRVGDGAAAETDRLVVEAPLEIRLGGVPIAVVMRTPGADEDLVAGFALTEGIVARPGELGAVKEAGEGRVELIPAPEVSIDPEQFRRNFYATSSCGVCGKASIDAVRVSAAVPPPGPKVTTATLLELPARLLAAQEAFQATGGLHAAAAFQSDGRLLAVREDIGRHNALDKLVGSLRAEWPLPPLGVVVSGRVSFELVQKAAVAGIPLICGISAASTLAVELGEEMGMTVVGFLRDQSLVVYCGPERVGV